MERVTSIAEIERYYLSALLDSVESARNGIVDSSRRPEKTMAVFSREVLRLEHELDAHRLRWMLWRAIERIVKETVIENADLLWNPQQTKRTKDPDIMIATKAGHPIMVADIIRTRMQDEKKYLHEIKMSMKKLRRTGAKRISMYFQDNNLDSDVEKYLATQTEIDIGRIKTEAP